MRRGDVLRLRPPAATGRVQQGRRYAVVLQEDALAGLSTVVVAPTSRSARPASFRPEIEVEGTMTRVLVEQLAAVDPTRLGDLVGHVSPEDEWGIDLALRSVLALR